MPTSFDYIIAGGGLTGCVVASRLKQAYPHRSVLIIESGPDSRNKAVFETPANAWKIGPEYYHDDVTVPQPHVDGRVMPIRTGRALGGGSAVNFGVFTRGDRVSFDEWAEIVGDQRWSYEGLLPYIKRSETYPNQDGIDAALHGHEGPIKPSREDRGYPLGPHMKEAMLATGYSFNTDVNSGDIEGVAQTVDSWSNNRRTYAANEYDLTGVEVWTEQLVAKISIQDDKAVGVVLADGREIEAKIEVIVACGALRTPKLLMLSGVGPKSELERVGIDTIVDSPGVGQNLHDHFMVAHWYKLRNPERGLAIGHEKFNSNPKFFEGNPMNWVLMASLSEEDARKAHEKDNKTTKRREGIEIPFMYVTPDGISPYPHPPIDGSHFNISIIILNSTSRGSVSLATSNPHDPPVIDPAYLSTEYDRAMFRTGSRLVAKMMESEAGRRISVGESPQGPFPPLTSEWTDEEIDARTRALLYTSFHPAGTAAMGDVVDAECRVKGVRGLRVVDASILPVSISGHLQAPLYGVAEQAAEMIIEGTK